MLRLPIEFEGAWTGVLAWHPASRTIAVRASRGLITYDVERAVVTSITEPSYAIRTIDWSPTGDQLLLAFDHRDLVQARAMPSARTSWTAPIGEAGIDEFRWAPDAQLVAGVGVAVVVFEAATGIPRWHHRRCRAGSARDAWCARDATWCADGSLLAIEWDDAFTVHRTDDGSVVCEGPLAPDRERVFWAHGEDTVFAIGTHRLVRRCPALGDRFVRSLTFSRDGSRFAAEGSEHVLHVGDDAGTRLIAGHLRTITSLTWSVGGALATGCRDGIVRMMSSSRAPLVKWATCPESIGAMHWSPDGTALLIQAPNSLYLLTPPVGGLGYAVHSSHRE